MDRGQLRPRDPDQRLARRAAQRPAQDRLDLWLRRPQRDAGAGHSARRLERPRDPRRWPALHRHPQRRDDQRVREPAGRRRSRAGRTTPTPVRAGSSATSACSRTARRRMSCRSATSECATSQRNSRPTWRGRRPTPPHRPATAGRCGRHKRPAFNHVGRRHRSRAARTFRPTRTPMPPATPTMTCAVASTGAVAPVSARPPPAPPRASLSSQRALEGRGRVVGCGVAAQDACSRRMTALERRDG